jgi:hypothetical protein
MRAHSSRGIRTRRGRGPGSTPPQSMRPDFHFHEPSDPGTNFRPAVLARPVSLARIAPPRDRAKRQAPSPPAERERGESGSSRAAGGRSERPSRPARHPVATSRAIAGSSKTVARLNAPTSATGDALRCSARGGHVPSTRRWAAMRPVSAAGGGRAVGELVDGSTRAWHEPSPAVRACPVEPVVRTRRAEGALERADAGVRGLRREIPIAALAPRAHL